MIDRVESSYAAGALDYIKGNLFDPRRMRVLPTNSNGGDDLVHRLMAQLSLARDQDHELFIFGSRFRTKPRQTDLAFGFTPNEGIDNIHMAQGDLTAVQEKIHENGAWHDGGMLILDRNTGRVMAIFLSFQTLSWQTDKRGQPLSGRTGYEAQPFDFSTGGGIPVKSQSPIAELTSLHRATDGAATLVFANMSNDTLDATGWSIEANADKTLTLQATTIPPGRSFVIELPAAFVRDKGGILTLYDREGLNVRPERWGHPAALARARPRLPLQAALLGGFERPWH
jgi:Uncharacterized conserved protein (DUF2278)